MWAEQALMTNLAPLHLSSSSLFICRASSNLKHPSLSLLLPHIRIYTVLFLPVSCYLFTHCLLVSGGVALTDTMPQMRLSTLLAIYSYSLKQPTALPMAGFNICEHLQPASKHGSHDGRS